MIRNWNRKLHLCVFWSTDPFLSAYWIHTTISIVCFFWSTEKFLLRSYNYCPSISNPTYFCRDLWTKYVVSLYSQVWQVKLRIYFSNPKARQVEWALEFFVLHKMAVNPALNMPVADCKNSSCRLSLCLLVSVYVVFSVLVGWKWERIHKTD